MKYNFSLMCAKNSSIEEVVLKLKNGNLIIVKI